ncbi:MAG: SRPBCC family protein [Chloroflexi bacterium]|nr:SRPBCC family protein [Chloroflexota bacterium]MCZ6891562.1 SRPBCC family protein [Chloroflexota bacterium]
MSQMVFTYRISINAKPEDVYAYVADLTKHGEWSENVKVEAVSDGPIGVDSTYRSTGRMMRKEFKNDIRVTEYEPSTRLSFIANDGKNEFLQEFTFSSSDAGTLLERKVSFEMNPLMGLLFKVMIGPLVSNPSMKKSLNNLKANMERAAP